MHPAKIIVSGLAIAAGLSLRCRAGEWPPIPLSEARTWAYQNAGIDAPGAVDALAASRYDLLVIESTRTDWSKPETRNFDTPAAVRQLKASTAADGKHRKLVLAYVSLGEAENWRWYWTGPTSWPSGAERPRGLPHFVLRPGEDQWEGCYPVAFWNPQWRDIVLEGKRTPPTPQRPYRSVMDEVLQSGFDGVYLDGVDAFEETVVEKAGERDAVDPESEMVRLIGDIRQYGRRRNPNFIVIQQNASDILDDHPDFLHLVDAAAQEDVWYSGEADSKWADPDGYDQKTPARDTQELLESIRNFKKTGKPVFTVDYTVAAADETYRRSRAEGFVPYCSRIALSRLTTTPPPELRK